MTDVPATHGYVEFHASRGIRMPKKGWYLWPSNMNSMEAFLADHLYGPFKDEAQAKETAEAGPFIVDSGPRERPKTYPRRRR